MILTPMVMTNDAWTRTWMTTKVFRGSCATKEDGDKDDDADDDGGTQGGDDDDEDNAGAGDDKLRAEADRLVSYS